MEHTESLKKWMAAASDVRLARLSCLSAASRLVALTPGAADKKAEAAILVARMFEKYVREGGAP